MRKYGIPTFYLSRFSAFFDPLSAFRKSGKFRNLTFWNSNNWLNELVMRASRVCQSRNRFSELHDSATRFNDTVMRLRDSSWCNFDSSWCTGIRRFIEWTQWFKYVTGIIPPHQFWGEIISMWFGFQYKPACGIINSGEGCRLQPGTGGVNSLVWFIIT